MKNSILIFCSCILLLSTKVITAQKTLKYLALGDSYTIGESVCNSCNYPSILKTSIEDSLKIDVSLEIIAETGWTTTNLKDAISAKKSNTDYDIVTLLIGVNNQYQKLSFSLYKKEFPELVNTAIKKANGNKGKVVIISIPDYAFTPFGKSKKQSNIITKELSKYNSYAKDYCLSEGISYIHITDITERGIDYPYLVAKDGLHPSKKAYELFVERIFPVVKEKLNY